MGLRRVYVCFSIMVAARGILWLLSRPNNADEYINNPNFARHNNHSNTQNTGKRTPFYGWYSNFTRMKFGPLYVFGATVGNSCEIARWDIVKLYASVHRTYDKSHISCCLKFHNAIGSDYDRQPVVSIGRPPPSSQLSPRHYTCLNRRPGVIPDGIALTIDNYTCSERHVTYRKPIIPLLETDIKIALCSKAAYGARSAELLIEWMETHIYLGVDKVVSYYLEDLNTDAKRVLEYYARTGKLDLYYFVPAAEDTLKRRYHPANPQSDSDKQVMIFDAFERMSGYRYFGVIDHDEFLIPPNGVSLKEYLADLYNKYEDAACFTFLLDHYYLQYGQVATLGDLILQRHITKNTGGPEFISQKNICKPKYVANGTIETHFPMPKKGFRRVRLKPEEGFIRHYRERCYRTCKTLKDRTNDTWVSRWSKRIEQNVKNVRQKIFDS